MKLDPRLEKRFLLFIAKLLEHLSVIIHQLGANEAEQRSFYRFINHKKMSISDLGDHIITQSLVQVEPRQDYVLFQDSTQLNFEWNRDNILPNSGLGVIGDNASLGFFAHPTLLMEAKSGRALGYSDIQTWIREAPDSSARKAGCKKRDYKKEPFESKESYRWYRAALDSVARIRAAGGQGRILIVSDQESDIHEVLTADFDEKSGVLVRSKGERKVLDPKDGKTRLDIRDYLSRRKTCKAHYTFTLPAQKRKDREGREAKMEIRWGKVTLRAPDGKKRKYGDWVGYAVWTRELHPPAGQAPIDWLLLTTFPIDSEEDALAMVEVYRWRWNAEQVFRVTKRKGFNAEESTLETGTSLIKLYLLTLLTASKIIGLHQASKSSKPVPLKKSFTQEELACMRALHGRYEGKTPKQKNPYPPDSLQWVYWIIARMGAWKPHEKQAGVIALARGYERFLTAFQGWQAAKEDVS